ncbi:50S ribosomal protein L14 [Candidatus Hodgkinia cicadicola]|uniref:50S ribosomal protein L14 n=1 Tax=Candidatus Hodgkinia cicadicola TaxID=573658 RepID=A0ABX4MFB1_9HYPH|nr:50S ribosomal protein L14 [Candidatus Hodgkinia cicadicola]
MIYCKDGIIILSKSIIRLGIINGMKFIRCIKIIGSTNKRWTKYGEVIKASATVMYTRSKIKQGCVVNTLIIRCIKPFNMNIRMYKVWWKFRNNLKW